MSLPAGAFVVFNAWSSGWSLQTNKFVLDRGEDLTLLSAGVHGGRRSGFLLLFLSMLLVAEGSSTLIPHARDTGQCFWECWGTRVSLAMQTRAEVCVAIGRVRHMRTQGTAELRDVHEHLQLQSTGLKYWNSCINLKEKGQASGHSCRYPLSPSLAWSKWSWRLEEGWEPPLGICCHWVITSFSWQKIPIAGREPRGAQAACTACLRRTQARTTHSAPKINSEFLWGHPQCRCQCKGKSLPALAQEHGNNSKYEGKYEKQPWPKRQE